MSEEVVLGIDVGGTNLRIGLVSRTGELSSARRMHSHAILAGHHPMATLARYLDNYLTTVLGQDQELVAISAGFPSTVDARHGRVISTSNIPGLDDVDVEAALSGLRVPVVIDRDVNMLLRHDSHELGLTDTPGVVFGCYVGTGLGSSFAIDGNVLIGKHGVAGELGHIPRGVDVVCGCGNTGCAEAVASGNALERQLKETHPDIGIADVFLTCGSEPFVETWLEHLGATIATPINILDPAAVIIGGGVVQANGFPRADLEARVRRMARKPLPAEDLTFVYSRPGHYNGVLGAGHYGFASIAHPLDGHDLTVAGSHPLNHQPVEAR